MNPQIYAIIEEINDNMVLCNESDKFIYRQKLFEILGKYLPE